ncbi:DUF3299 domain-containing protein [Catenovulum sp. SM1970]|uniref:DUF3299 domain-containing protein n=1 Tax=Marinifaba aquimaris TaxID=2741323 RepID=UPI001571CC5F|nr:DUF3299 domain-containing protein [Marinifaba aquimaris]NTS78200.1 DUF3299 domain-containing protein [Marinifaba aquimaris]
MLLKDLLSPVFSVFLLLFSSSVLADIVTKPEQKKPATVEKKVPTTIKTFREVEWTELIPEDDLNAILNPPSYIDDIEDGSIEDQIGAQVENGVSSPEDDVYQRALNSTRIIEKMNNQAIKIPGFIVPLEFNEDRTISRFFLVPYFGACLHMPPPPPNQIIFVTAEPAIEFQSLYDAFWISGMLKTKMFESEMATSAYTLDLADIEYYDQPAAN